MDSNRVRHQKLQAFREPLDRRVDKLIETGLQVVDGVAGNRPGKRRLKSMRVAGSGLDKVGRWVGDKLDWFLEDEDDWVESWQPAVSQTVSSGKKRPLEAISRRAINKTKTEDSSISGPQQNSDQDEWPEESSFRVERWQRGQLEKHVDHGDRVQGSPRDSSRLEKRPLPRSSRRRY